MSAPEVTLVDKALRRAQAPTPTSKRDANLRAEADPRSRELQDKVSLESSNLTKLYILYKMTSIIHRARRTIPCSGEKKKLTWVRQKKIGLFIQVEREASHI